MLYYKDKVNDDTYALREEMTTFAVEAGLPSACMSQAEASLEHGRIQAYEYLLEKASQCGYTEAIEKLKLFRSTANPKSNTNSSTSSDYDSRYSSKKP